MGAEAGHPQQQQPPSSLRPGTEAAAAAAPPAVLGLQLSALIDHVARVDWSLLDRVPGDRGGSQQVLPSPPPPPSIHAQHGRVAIIRFASAAPCSIVRLIHKIEIAIPIRPWNARSGRVSNTAVLYDCQMLPFFLMLLSEIPFYFKGQTHPRNPSLLCHPLFGFQDVLFVCHHVVV